jgi:DNA-binding CsgD family transcriptional regulator
VIAERTVSTHLERVFRKLRLHARAQLGAWVAAEGLLADHPVAVGHAD